MSAHGLSLRQSAARAADFLRDHAALLRGLQWAIVGVYAFLLIVPACLPLPGSAASVFDNLTVLAQFAFWGVWWPFVLVSMPLLGRAWCGWLCPEGMLTEWASERGQGRAIPKWMRWGGWPFVAFAGTTVYGQLVSVYQYPLAALAVLGGSTLAALAVGWRYGRGKRVWCRHLCPVNGVFNLLARLAPWHFRVDAQAWRRPAGRTQAINCAPLVPLRHMQGAGDCHMCGRCSGYRGAIALTPRSPESEIVEVAHGEAWQTALIAFGLMGLAVGAFLWSASPWFVALKQWAAAWLIDRDIYWPLADNAPWFVLTHYPEVNDSFSWLDGACIVLFALGGALLAGGPAWAGAWLADRLLPGPGNPHRMAQAMIPAAGAGVFLGLSATTVTLLRHEGLKLAWVPAARFALLALALAWTLRLAWRLAGGRQPVPVRRLPAMAAMAAGLAPFATAWVLFFAVW